MIDWQLVTSLIMAENYLRCPAIADLAAFNGFSYCERIDYANAMFDSEVLPFLDG